MQQVDMLRFSVLRCKFIFFWRRHHNRNWDKKRSRSRSGERRSRSRDKKRRARSRSNSKSKHRHRSKSRSDEDCAFMILHETQWNSEFVLKLWDGPILSREKKKRTEKVRRKSCSRSASPVTFRGRNTAMDAQEALARRYSAVLFPWSTK